MSIRAKRILYIAFIIIFFIANPVILFYSMGYRFNSHTFALELTGSLYISTEPKKPKIFLDGAEVSFSAPKRIRYLLPDRYTVTLRKDSYFDWTRDVEISSGKTTFIEDVVLVQKKSPVLLFESQKDIFGKTPDETKIWFLDSTQNGASVSVYDISRSTTTARAILGPDIAIHTIAPSPLSAGVLFVASAGNIQKFFIFNSLTGSLKLLNIPPYKTFEKIIWDHASPSILYGFSQEILYQINVEENTQRAVFSGEIEDFIVSGNFLYFIKKDSQGYVLSRKRLFDAKSAIDIRLPGALSYSIYMQEKNFLEIQDKEKNFFLVQADIFDSIPMVNAEKFIFSLGKGKSIQWIKSKKSILLSDDFEISLSDLKKQKKYVMNRTSRRISKTESVLEGAYIAVLTENNILITENSPYKKNAYQLTNSGQVVDFFSSGKKNEILFIIEKQKEKYVLGTLRL